MEIKLKSGRKVKVKEIRVAEVNVTLFSNQNALEVYEDINFYPPEKLEYEVNDSFFEQASMDEYNKQMYQNISLSSYIHNDPVEVHRRRLEEISMKKRALMIELEQLRNQ